MDSNGLLKWLSAITTEFGLWGGFAFIAAWILLQNLLKPMCWLFVVWLGRQIGTPQKVMNTLLEQAKKLKDED